MPECVIFFRRVSLQKATTTRCKHPVLGSSVPNRETRFGSNCNETNGFQQTRKCEREDTWLNARDVPPYWTSRSDTILLALDNSRGNLEFPLHTVSI